MGLFDKIRGEFVDIVEWLDPSNDTLVYRFERYQNEIKYGAKLTVRESQVAVFINEGTVADVYKPGMYTLETQNMPIMSTLRGWKYGFNSPFKAEVYFVNTKNFTDLKWGTKNPIPLRDADFGIVRLKAFGTYVMRCKDPVQLVRAITGTDGKFTIDGITDQLKSIIATRFADSLAESKIPALDLAAQYDEFSTLVQKKVSTEFEEYGIEITKLLIENISFPPEVEAAIDKRSSMGAIGNLGAYTQFQAANAMEAAAKNPGGDAGAGIGMGMGFAMANQMGQAMSGNMQNQQQQNQQGPPPPPVPAQLQFYTVLNGQQSGPHNEAMLKQMVTQGLLKADTLVWKQGMTQWLPASQVPEMAGILAQVPPPLPPQ